MKMVIRDLATYTPASTHWFQRVGLSFDPFVHLEASNDPHLSDYIVNLAVFRVAIEAVPAIIIAPPGGGKTAMRVAVTQSCWFDMGGSYPFPLPYNLGMAPLTGKPPTTTQHLRMLLEAGTCALLTGLAFRPERLLRASDQAIKTTAAILRAGLPGSLDYYLTVLRETGTPVGLTPLLERTYALNAPPPPDVLRVFCDVLSSPAIKAMQGEVEDVFQAFIEILTGTLGFSHILMLIDGVDSVYENQLDSKFATEWFYDLLNKADMWAKSKVFLKLFIPDVMETVLSDRLQRWPFIGHTARIVWDQDLLVTMLRRRISVASEGWFDSLDAISTPALIDVERQLVSHVPHLPRVVLQVTRQALLHCAGRADDEDQQLDEEDIQYAIAWYQQSNACFMKRILQY